MCAGQTICQLKSKAQNIFLREWPTSQLGIDGNPADVFHYQKVQILLAAKFINSSNIAVNTNFARVNASRRKRFRAASFASMPGGRILIATSRSSCSSEARTQSPCRPLRHAQVSDNDPKAPPTIGIPPTICDASSALDPFGRGQERKLKTRIRFPLEFQTLYSVRMEATPEAPRPDGTMLDEAFPIHSSGACATLQKRTSGGLHGTPRFNRYFSSTSRSRVDFMTVMPSSIIRLIEPAASFGRRSAIQTNRVWPSGFAKTCADAL